MKRRLRGEYEKEIENCLEKTTMIMGNAKNNFPLWLFKVRSHLEFYDDSYFYSRQTNADTSIN